MMPTSISQIIEQVFNAAFSIGAAWFFIQQFATNDTEHAKFGAAGGTLGTGAGVLAGLCFMVIVYGKPFCGKWQRTRATAKNPTAKFFRFFF